MAVARHGAMAMQMAGSWAALRSRPMKAAWSRKSQLAVHSQRCALFGSLPAVCSSRVGCGNLP